MDVAPSAYAYPLLVRHLLHTPLATAATQEIVYRDRRRHDYIEFRRRIGRLASVLAGQGVGHGTTVAFMDWDSHRYLEAFFAVPMLGAVLQTVNVRLSPDQIHYTLDHAGAEIVVVHADFVPLLADIRAKLPRVRACILIADDAALDSMGIPFDGEYEALLAAADPNHPFHDFDENTRATTFYTSGTTGLPKGVHFSHRQLVLHTLSAALAYSAAPAASRLHRDDVYMPLTPMFHVHAWGIPYIATLLGLKQVYPGRYVPATICKLIAGEGVTFSHCVPTVLQMVLAAAENTDLSRWKVVIGGSAFPRGLAAAALARGIDVFAGYGMSETGPLLTLTRAIADPDLEAQTAARTRTGFPIPLVDLRTVDADGVPTPRDGQTSGEVVVRAPWLTQGYTQNPAASATLWSGGYLHTGDIGTLDDAGCLRITDRLKDVIKTGGEWISSLDLESLISQHPSVSEAAVVGVPDEKWGERPRALVVLKPGHAPDPEALRAWVGQAAAEGRISRYAVPEAIDFVAELPRTSVGKLDKKLMRQRLA
ncbi:MAG TPA: fatty acid--CoA ligase [Rhodocyclaceae bacterium]|jgi:fatty-acyl-CoA synthase|nr:fatty acid--CoA ligase [Rhodocyclaceae bacterium]HNM81753.1 fatty acid--CoA ligase [Rhodocyclaceae bacterium]HNP04875.1 fatty acid--CoA ligase [Rhodocyclaceae bacterium]